MSRRAVMRHLSSTEWKLANRLAIPAGETTLSRLVLQDWIETEGEDHKPWPGLPKQGWLCGQKFDAIRQLAALR